jgi:hypothetical protein
MKRLEVSGAVRHIYMSLGGKGLRKEIKNMVHLVGLELNA